MIVEEELLQSVMTSPLSTEVWQETLDELRCAQVISARDASRIAAVVAELFPVSVTLSEVAESATFEGLLDSGQQLGNEFDLKAVVRKLREQIPDRALGAASWQMFALYGFASAVQEHGMNGAVLALAVLTWASLRKAARDSKEPSTEAPSSMTTECRVRLFSLMRDLFTNEELRRILYFLPEGKRMVDSLPSTRESRANFAFEALLVMERHGALDGVLVRELAAARPAAQRHIEVLGRCLSGDRSTMIDASIRPHDPDASPRLSPLGSHEERELVDELARVFYERDLAMLVARRGGCPTQNMPDFPDPFLFWAGVVQEACNGSRDDGIERIIEAAIKERPSNPVFLRLRQGCKGTSIRG